MKRFYIWLMMCAISVAVNATVSNVALTCKNVSASYTSSWNNLYSINNGTKGFGTDLPNSETWGCYISTTGNQAEQYLTYTWDKKHRLESVTVYFWSDAQSGSGVAVPESWEILYLDENDEWKSVVLTDGEQYGLERFEANSAAFTPVETYSIRLLLHAQLNGSNYSAMGVNEWEVYGECIEEDVIDTDAKINVAEYVSEIEATYTSSWNNLQAINNGTKGTANTLSNSETWGCWQSPNAESQALTYWWSENYSIDSVSVYFWSDSESGIGVVVPQSWKIEYYSGREWIPVTLLEGETYGTARLEANHIKFQAVNTYGLRLVMNAYLNEDGQYAAIGVTEWEVYSADMNYAQKLFIEYNALVDEITDFEDDVLLDIEGLMAVLEDAKMDYEVDPDESDPEVVQNAITKLKEIYDSVKAAYTQIEEMNTLFEQIAVMLEDGTYYPGYEEFEETYNEGMDFADNGYGTPEEIDEMYTKLSESINTYRFSQLYSADEPADYSFLGKSMQFIKADAAPTINLEEGTVVYPYADTYVDASQPSDAVSTGWYLGETDGDQQVRWQQQRMCWYACKTGANDLTINQNLKDLPSGYYAVSAEMITQEGKLNGQHIFAKTSATTVVSPNLSIEGWDESATDSKWERLTTDKILVYDGKLTIGADGPGDNVTNTGMFCVTNFILYYYGPTDADNIATLYAEKIEECQNECNTMVYAADRKLYQDIIDANKNATGYEEINTALKALNSAQVIAQRSINTYNKFLVGPYKTLTDNIENKYEGNSLTAAQYLKAAIDAENASEDATYKNASVQNTVINYFMDNYVSVLVEAEGTTSTNEEVNKAIKETIDVQMSYLSGLNAVPTTEELYELIYQLETAINLATIAEVIENKGTDYTALIKNATVRTSAGTGWTINNENGDGTGIKSNQHFDGKTGYYFNSYNATAGKLKYTVSQTINNAPNGTYKLGVMMRVSATPNEEGVYLYAFADEDTEAAQFASARMQQHTFTTEDGSDSIAYVTDTYGSVWENALEWLNNNSITDNDTYDYYADIFEANGEKGYGWQYVNLEVEVKNHILTLGVTCDSDLTLGHTDTEGNACVAFSGTWFSADNFTLTLLKEGDNTGWSPATGIESLNVQNSKTVENIYSINGTKVNNMVKGVYIVRMSDGTTKKILK